MVPSQARWVPASMLGEPPAPLVSHTATLWRDRSIIIIGGGRHTRSSSDVGLWHMSAAVHALELEAMRWARHEVGGDEFVGRRGHCAVLFAHADAIVVFGGVDSHGPSGHERTRCDVSVLALSADGPWTWRTFDACASSPSPRRGHCGWLSHDGASMLVFGGFCAHGAHAGEPIAIGWHDAQLHALRAESVLGRAASPGARPAWARLETTGEAPLVALATVALTHDRAHAVLCGGIHQRAADRFRCTVAVLEQRSLAWSRVLVPGRMPARYSAAAAFVGDTLLLFGGTDLPMFESELARPDHADMRALELGAELRAVPAAAGAAASGAGAEGEAAPCWVQLDRRMAPPPPPPGAGYAPHDAPEPGGARSRAAEASADAPAEPASDAPQLAEDAPLQPALTLELGGRVYAAGSRDAAPSPRNGMTLTAVRGGATLVVVGGGVFRAEGGEYFDEVWLFHIGPDTGLSRAGPTGPEPLARGPAAEGGALSTGGGRAPPHADGGLSEDLGRLLASARGADVCFELDRGERVCAHALVLGARCDYFRALLSGGFGEACAGGSGAERVVRVPHVPARAFRAALRFLYTGRLPGLEGGAEGAGADCGAEGAGADCGAEGAGADSGTGAAAEAAWAQLAAELLMLGDMWTCAALRAAVLARIERALGARHLSLARALEIGRATGATELLTLAAERLVDALLFPVPRAGGAGCAADGDEADAASSDLTPGGGSGEAEEGARGARRGAAAVLQPATRGGGDADTQLVRSAGLAAGDVGDRAFADELEAALRRMGFRPTTGAGGCE